MNDAAEGRRRKELLPCKQAETQRSEAEKHSTAERGEPPITCRTGPLVGHTPREDETGHARRSSVASLSPERAQIRARIAATKRHHPDRPDLIEDDQRTLKMARAEDFLRELVESAPPLRPEDVERLRALLPAVPDGGEDAA